jgi:hypothetical protein
MKAAAKMDYAVVQVIQNMQDNSSGFTEYTAPGLMMTVEDP